MGQQNNLAAAIAYFESQSELSPFAAQVAKWLTELKAINNQMRVFKFENVFKETEYDYQCGAALAIVAAKDAEQAKNLMVSDKYGFIKAIDGSVILKSQLDGFDLNNPVEIPCLQTTLNEPTVITISEYYEV